MTTPSDKQFDAMHLFFRQLADALNETGVTRNAVWAIKRVEVPWNEESVKEDLWKPIQQAMYPDTVTKSGKVTTKKCGGACAGKVHEALMSTLNNHWQIWVEFPHEQD